jgi:hypothetical protein
MARTPHKTYDIVHFIRCRIRYRMYGIRYCIFDIRYRIFDIRRRIRYRIRRRIQKWQEPLKKHTISYILYDVVYDIVCLKTYIVYDIVSFFLYDIGVSNIRHRIFDIRYRIRYSYSVFAIGCRIRYHIVLSYTKKMYRQTVSLKMAIRCRIRYLMS